MSTRPTYEVETVRAAAAGDRGAVDELVRSHLPLVYNIVGRAMDGHPDVDDVVQETMARVVTGVSGLRDPASFRSWLVAIALNQVREWRRSSGSALAGLDEALGMADPGSDFAALTVTRLGLSGQRKETAEAVRWLDAADHEVLALWWMELAGALSRAELAAGLGMSEPHAAVRVQRAKGRLETARAVVRALSGRPRCEGLAGAAASWDGTPSDLWRKRLARHVRDCPACTGRLSDLVPAERLLAGLGLVAVPAGIAAGALELARTVAPAVKGGLLAKGKAAVGAAGSSLAVKPIAVAVVGATLVGGGVVAVQSLRPEPPPRRAAPAPAPSTLVRPTRGTPTPAASRRAATPKPSRSPSPEPTPSPAGTRRTGPYGRTVDQADQAPPRNRPPARLPRRPAAAITVGGRHGYSRFGGAPSITHRGDYVTITGRGYVQVRWGILYRNRIGPFVPATWTGLKGRLFHVASGGGRRMDDEQAPGVTWMGSPETGFVRLPAGQQQMWQNEFYYLDGSVTFHNNEAGTDVDLTVAPRTWNEVWADLSARPDPGRGVLRYGLTRDTGDDRAPVPQYLTRSRPADPARVPQRSRVSTG
ncbi:sigma-70 family RNA polymerase sigma factor [Nonomuraea sp. SMC257]|uniref:Sigma-70 family RNA polymerase sigma factor n=1 Tax=Nonomuraea montanisoli TaxID=2741721 RepID=A0A7Y6I719_9ACTN|nr:sigma-70 family RNA polymerase sigma factor [Nonomuraea montanisoli]NUW31629.1 sigma-70 family RNA polymerase sigma factor [Nonomuraea montanisoli]